MASGVCLATKGMICGPAGGGPGPVTHVGGGLHKHYDMIKPKIVVNKIHMSKQSGVDIMEGIIKITNVNIKED